MKSKSLIYTSLLIILLTFKIILNVNTASALVGTAVKVPTFSSYGYPMWVQLPDGYSSTSSTKYPLIMFLHGVGERALDGGNNVS